MGCCAWGTLNFGSPVIATLERSVAVAEGGFGPFFDRQCDRAGSPVTGGLGHAMIVGAVACDLSWRDGRSSVFGVQGDSREAGPNCLLDRNGLRSGLDWAGLDCELGRTGPGWANMSWAGLGQRELGRLLDAHGLGRIATGRAEGAERS
ncbi:hypothetical protein CRG98_033159 [Punica granatum]|uniref:Uncharacterized protein n=1 Tax=Punica granatum TaxID=22663 RepID=A0A2I0IR37_PUNGR|nr:hypothetical protein CRG98_033159 [Punica granatum]